MLQVSAPSLLESGAYPPGLCMTSRLERCIDELNDAGCAPRSMVVKFEKRNGY